jgi:hypothetical protein
MTTTDELRTLVAQRADTALRGVDIDGLVAIAAQRGRRRRRARVAGGAVAAAATVAAAVLVVPQMVAGQNLAPVDVPAPKHGFPGTLDGGLLLDAATGVGSASVTVPAGETNLAWAVTCEPAASKPVTLLVSLRGPDGGSTPMTGEDCTGSPPSLVSFESGWDAVESIRTEVGAGPDDPVTLTVRSEGGRAPVGIGAYAKVPLDQYPLPPAPDPLPDLQRSQVWGSDGEPVTPLYEAELTWAGRTSSTAELDLPAGDGLSILVRSQTPADVTVRLDGEPVLRHTVYDYEQRPMVAFVDSPVPEGLARLDVVVDGEAGEVQLLVVAGDRSRLTWGDAP